MARLIDNKATSVFQRHCTHLASFVSAALNPTISVCFLLVAACTLERGLSSESNSVSSPPTPSIIGDYISHLDSSEIICMDYLRANRQTAVEHIDDFDFD